MSTTQRIITYPVGVSEIAGTNIFINGDSFEHLFQEFSVIELVWSKSVSFTVPAATAAGTKYLIQEFFDTTSGQYRILKVNPDNTTAFIAPTSGTLPLIPINISFTGVTGGQAKTVKALARVGSISLTGLSAGISGNIRYRTLRANEGTDPAGRVLWKSLFETAQTANITITSADITTKTGRGYLPLTGLGAEITVVTAPAADTTITIGYSGALTKDQYSD